MLVAAWWRFPSMMAQVDVGAAGIESHLQAEFLAALEQPDKFLPGDDLADSAGDRRLQVFWADGGDGGHARHSGPGLGGSRPRPD